MADDDDLDMLRSQWTELYSKILPNLAKNRDPAQSKWPVTLDHCFARIILDNTIGRGVLQWDNVIKKPAVRNMDESQFKAAIKLGEAIRHGEADLVQLDQQSLLARGKGQHKYKTENESVSTTAKKRGADSEALKNSPSKRSKQSTLSFSPSRTTQEKKTTKSSSSSNSTRAQPNLSFSDATIEMLLDKISQHPNLTPYRKRLYSTLLSVPTGSYTTYAAMAKYLESSARAVGNGMRNNPFAPDVPCHRVLAADGSIGGFHGDWGKDGKYANHKVTLLSDEGVKFDSRGKVRGPVFTALQDLSKTRTGKEGLVY